MIRTLRLSLLLLLLVAAFSITNDSSTFAKQNSPKKGVTCKELGKTSGLLTCVKNGSKKTWQKIFLGSPAEKFPIEGSNCSNPGITTLGTLSTKYTGEVTCVKSKGILGGSYLWASKAGWTYESASSNPSKKLLAEAWRSITEMPAAKSKINVVYHIEPGVNPELVSIYKVQQEKFLEKFGDYLEPNLPFHTVISISIDFLQKTNKEIDKSIPGYSEWFSMSYAENRFNEALNKKLSGYPYASKKDVCAKSINSNYRETCEKLNGYVSGLLAYPNYTLFGYENTFPSAELFELVQERIANNHFAWPGWLRSGGPAFIASALIPNSELLSTLGGPLNPIPDVRKNQIAFDFNEVESHSSSDKYSIGRYANGYLIGTYGINEYMRFLSRISSGSNWESELSKFSGMSKSEFYSKLSDFIVLSNKS